MLNFFHNNKKGAFLGVAYSMLSLVLFSYGLKCAIPVGLSGIENCNKLLSSIASVFLPFTMPNTISIAVFSESLSAVIRLSAYSLRNNLLFIFLVVMFWGALGAFAEHIFRRFVSFAFQ